MYSDAQQQEFKAACEPLLMWLNSNGNPHMSVIVRQTNAELVSGEIAFETMEFCRG